MISFAFPASKGQGRFALLALLSLPLLAANARAQVPQDQAATMLLDSGRRAYNEKNYPVAVTRFQEFVTKFAGHRDLPAARYGLAVALIDGPTKDYISALPHLQQIAGQTQMPERPHVLYYTGLARRGLGVQALVQAATKAGDAKTLKANAQQHFADAEKQFGEAGNAFAARVKADSMAKEAALDREWAARARCDQAEMLLRLLKPKEAQAAVAPFVQDKTMQESRYRGLGLYYHGFASFLLKDNLAAGKSLGLLAPFNDPVFGTHARYLLARVQHLEGERAEASAHYDAVLADHAKAKLAAGNALKQPERFKNDPEEKARLEELVRGQGPDHVARSTFFLGVMQYEDGKFAEALTRLAAFVQQFPGSPLAPEAQLRQGFCQVQMRQYAEAQKTLQPLVDQQPRLADQALLWIAKAQIGSANPADANQQAQAQRTGIDTLRKAADRAGQQAASDPEAKVRRAEILAEMADTQQHTGQFKEAADVYQKLLNDNLLPARQEELMVSLATALHLAGDYKESEKICTQFIAAHPKSLLLPAVLFRHAENAQFTMLAAEKNANAAERAKEVARLNDEVLKRYQVVVEKYPEYPHAHVARHGMAMAWYRKGDLDKARAGLESIPQPERNGELAVVPYQLADIMIRQAPTQADDAVAAGRMEEALKGAADLLEGFVAAQPKGPQAADALLKLGFCQQRLAMLLAQPAEKQAALTRARTAFDTIIKQFPQHEQTPQAMLERARCLHMARDPNTAINELRRFTQDPLKNTPVAPLAVIQLATLLRGQKKAAEAAKLLSECRQQHENNLAKDPARAGWIPLLLYHHALALREADKRGEARSLFEQVTKQAPDRPEAAEAALRAGQCLKDDGQQRIATARKKLAGGLKPEALAAARKELDDGVKDLQGAIQYLLDQAERLKQKQPNALPRARMYYEAAWGYRFLADLEIEKARHQIQQDLWTKQRDEAMKKLPPGRQPPYLPAPVVPLTAVPVQPSETQARNQYQALVNAFPDLATNADARFELAELLGERGEHDQAIAMLRQALDKEPGPELTERVRLRLGASLMSKGDAKNALVQFNLIVQNPKSPLYPQALYRVGECQIRLGDHEAALKLLEKFRDQGPLQNVPDVSDRALLRVGQVLGQTKQWELSREAYQTLLQRFPNSPWAAEARYGLGWALQTQGQYDQAVKEYAQVPGLTATELAAQAQVNIGLCRLAQKRYAEASTAFLVVPFTYDYPQLNALALLEAARAFAENRQKDEAIRLLERMLRDHPEGEHAEAARKRLEELRSKG